MDAWKRLGRAVANRRAELRLSQGELHGRGGPSLASVQSIEGARSDTYRDRTLADLERALGWERGSVETILFSGGQPTLAAVPLNAAPSPRTSGMSTVIEAVLNDPTLLPEAKQHLINQYGLLQRVQAAASFLPPVAPSIEPVTPAEEQFVAQGKADLAKEGELHVVQDDKSCR